MAPDVPREIGAGKVTILVHLLGPFALTAAAAIGVIRLIADTTTAAVVILASGAVGERFGCGHLEERVSKAL